VRKHATSLRVALAVSGLLLACSCGRAPASPAWDPDNEWVWSNRRWVAIGVVHAVNEAEMASVDVIGGLLERQGVLTVSNGGLGNYTISVPVEDHERARHILADVRISNWRQL
jgi:hypothetical protein